MIIEELYEHKVLSSWIADLEPPSYKNPKAVIMTLKNGRKYRVNDVNYNQWASWVNGIETGGSRGKWWWRNIVRKHKVDRL